MTDLAAPLVLHVEDDSALRETTSLVLQQHGFVVHSVPDGPSGLLALEQISPDILLLDVMLPGLDGISLTRRIRERSELPVVLLTARGDPLDVVAGLEAGADDYVVKPFDGPVLAARLRAALRRIRPLGVSAANQIRVGDLEIDLDAVSVVRHGVTLALTPTEMRLLTELAEHRGVVLSRDQLLERVWGYDWTGDTRLVDVHVQRLRAKVGDGVIVTVRGRGYRMDRT